MKRVNLTYKVKPETIKKQFDDLVYLKDKLDTYENYPLQYWKQERGVSSTTLLTVKKLGIVNNVGGNIRNARWAWNDKIPVTTKLATTVISETRKAQNDYKISSAKKDKIVVPAKVELKQRDNEDAEQTNVGIIRRFFRWIY